MIGFFILKILTTVVLAILAISSVWTSVKQKSASEGVMMFSFAMFIAFGIAFMWV